MPIIFHCSCGKKLQAKDEMAGRHLKCPACHTVLSVPGSPLWGTAEDPHSVPLAEPVLAGESAGELASVPMVRDEGGFAPQPPRRLAAPPVNLWVKSLDQQSTPWQGDDKERLNRGMAFREVPEFLLVLVTLLLLAGLAAGAVFFWPATKEKRARTDDKLDTGLVQGKITYKGLPLPSGFITFHMPSKEPFQDNIFPDGSYQAVGLPPGQYKVTVETKEIKGMPPGAKMDPKSKGPPKGLPQFKPPKFVAIPKKYADPNTSGLAVEVKVGKQTPFDIDLKE
jgi:hypothetical protein